MASAPIRQGEGENEQPFASGHLLKISSLPVSDIWQAQRQGIPIIEGHPPYEHGNGRSRTGKQFHQIAAACAFGEGRFCPHFNPRLAMNNFGESKIRA